MSDWEVVSETQDWDVVNESPEERQSLTTGQRRAGLLSRAVAQGSANALTWPLDLAVANANRQANAQGVNPSFRFKSPSEFVSGRLDDVGMPKPETSQERVASDVVTGVVSAGVPVGVVGSVAPASTFVARPLLQMLSGGVSAGASGAARESGASPLAQLLIGLGAGYGVSAVGGAVSDKIRGAVSGNWKKPIYGALDKASKEHDVPLSAGDMSGGAFAPKVETALEQVPGIGMGGYREAQHLKAKNAAQDFVEEFNPGASESWPQVAQESIIRRANRMRQIASSQYDELDALTADKAVPVGRVVDAIDEQIGKLGGAIDNKPALKGQLQSWKEALLQKYRKGNFSTLRQFRSDLRDEMVDAARKDKPVLAKIKSALEDDMAEFARKEGGDIWEKWRSADTFYRTQLVPTRKLASQFQKIEDPDQLYRTFLSTAKTRPQTIYDAMGPQAKAAVQYGILNDALETALKEGGDKFSPARFARYIDDRQRTVGVMFNDVDKRRVEGLVALMSHARRAGQYAENPPTGARWLVQALTAGIAPAAYFAPVTTAATATLGLATKLLMTTEAGKKLLLTASKRPTDAAYIDAALRAYGPAVGALAAQQANRDTSSEQLAQE